MITKILHIAFKVIAGLFLFYLGLGFIILPLVLTWAIPSQGTEFLKTPVHLRSVSFNPLMLQLTMKDLAVLDGRNQEILGFDKLFVDVSFLALFKKIYRVEKIELDGLKVNAELLPGNKINLMTLMPPEPVPSKSASKPVEVPVQKPGPLPNVVIDSIILHQGQVHFTDKTVNPSFLTNLEDMELQLTNVTTHPQDESAMDFHADLDDKGRISMHAVMKPLAQPLEMEISFKLNDYALGVLTPYSGKYTGRELQSGKLDLRMDYRIGDNKLTASHKLLIQRFAFGKPVESRDALHLPFGLAVALLEDPGGKINIALPVTGDMSSPKFQYSHLLVQVIRNFFINLVTKPFSFLAASLGGEAGVDELGYVSFVPGKSDLVDSQKKKMLKLIQSLREHPRLLLEIEGSYDPETDWKAIQADIFEKDYQELRKISSRPDGAVYQMLYQRRFGIRALWALAKKYKHGIGEYNDPKLDAEIKRRLIENAPPDTSALNMLAETRAKQVDDFLLARGFDKYHLSLGRPQSTQSSMGYVPLPFTLTVYDRK